MKVIKIEGFRGIISAIFIGICLFAGFIVFPGQVSMSLWNKYLVTLLSFPSINNFQGILLWGIIATSYCILSKGGLAVSFKSSHHELSDSELNMILKNARENSRMRKLGMIIPKNDEFANSNPYNKDLSASKEEQQTSSLTSVNNEEKDKTISNYKE